MLRLCILQLLLKLLEGGLRDSSKARQGRTRHNRVMYELWLHHVLVGRPKQYRRPGLINSLPNRGNALQRAKTCLHSIITHGMTTDSLASSSVS